MGPLSYLGECAVNGVVNYVWVYVELIELENMLVICHRP